MVSQLRPIGLAALAALLISSTATAAQSPQRGPAAAPAAPAITLPDGRGLSPAGTMVAGGDFPGAGLLAGAHGLLIDTTGSQPNQVAQLDPGTLAPIGTVTPRGAVSTSAAPWAQTGHLSLSPDGATLYAAGGATNGVDVFSLPVAGPPKQSATISAPGFVGGVAADPDGQHLFVTLPFDGSARYDKGTKLVRLSLAGPGSTTATTGAVPWDVTTGTVAGRSLVVTADRDAGTVSIFDSTTMRLVSRVYVGRQPAAPTFTPDGHLLVLASLDDALVEVEPLRGTIVGSVSLAEQAGKLGGAPSALALSPGGHTAYVALSADNALAVVARPTAGQLSLSGRIPTAIYPTSVTLDGALGVLLVTTGKGTGEQVGVPLGTPVPDAPPVAPGPTGVGVSGVVESIPLPDPSTLSEDTAQVLFDNRVASVSAAAPCSPPTSVPSVSPAPAVTHVIYVIRENKTYDEEFGDEPGGLAANDMYPRSVTPNAHALAERFGLMESFYADEEVSDTGHQVVMGSVANDWVQRLSQQAYGLDGAPRQGSELGNGSDVLTSPSDYLFDDALAGGISFRDYGEFYRQDQAQNGPAVTPQLDSHIVHDFPGFGFSPDVPDTKRIAFWQQGFAQDVARGTLPSLEVLYLPEDHTTSGLTSTPQQQVADADLALGQLVDTVSHSPYWGSTAIFMTEDDPQSGQDHVDEHRTLGLTISPWTNPGQQVSTHLDQTGMLRTVEELLGLPPLTEFDANSTSLASLFGSRADTRPFSVLSPAAPALSAAATSVLRRDARRAIPGATEPNNLAPQIQRRLTALAHAEARKAYAAAARHPRRLPSVDRPLTFAAHGPTTRPPGETSTAVSSRVARASCPAGSSDGQVGPSLGAAGSTATAPGPLSASGGRPGRANHSSRHRRTRRVGLVVLRLLHRRQARAQATPGRRRPSRLRTLVPVEIRTLGGRASLVSVRLYLLINGREVPVAHLLGRRPTVGPAGRQLDLILAAHGRLIVGHYLVIATARDAHGSIRARRHVRLLAGVRR